MSRRISLRRAPTLVMAVLLATAATLSGGATATGRPARDSRSTAAATFTNRVFASGAGLVHPTPAGNEPISQPDDITRLGNGIYVGFQNGVGPQGQASPTGNRDSTVVEFDLSGHPVRQWDVLGKCDGVTADPALGRVIATVDEDANSSVYLIDPDGAADHFHYSIPLPSRGGTDAITIYHGLVLISASAPGTTGAPAPQPTYPAAYVAHFDHATHTARLRALFYDESTATVANLSSPDHGHTTALALTDPDSNEAVPAYADRFAGDFMLTSQGDEEQIFVTNAGRPDQALSVLKLTGSVDDSAWPTGPGALLTTDNSNNTVNEITGPFVRGSEIAADTPCDETAAPATCPAPGFPPNFLVRANPDTGVLTALAVRGPAVQPQGMLFLGAPTG